MEYHYEAHEDIRGKEDVRTSTYRDGERNFLYIYEIEEDDVTSLSPEVHSFLDECGYDGDGNWELLG